MSDVTIHSTAELETYAQGVLDELAALPHSGATVLALVGELGAGKTAFVKALAKNLGVTEHVTSPTFVIMKTYDVPQTIDAGFKTLTHIDVYRLESAHELEVLGWAELLADPDALIAVEWPEKVPGAIPSDAHQFVFRHVDENTRTITRMSA